MTSPQISVIIPCYNQESYIAEAIESVLAQSFKDYEIIVVNDGSVDSSLSIIERYAQKNPSICCINQKNQGVVAARNNGIRKARGNLIFPLDGDDKIAPDCLSKLHQAIAENKGDVIFCDVERFGNERGVINYHGMPSRIKMCFANRVCVSALYRKEDWQHYGGYDELMRTGWEDWEFWLNFIEEDKSFYKVEEPLFFYRILKHSRNNSIPSSTEKELLNRIMNKHPKLFTRQIKLLCKIKMAIKPRTRLRKIHSRLLRIFKKTNA